MTTDSQDQADGDRELEYDQPLSYSARGEMV